MILRQVFDDGAPFDAGAASELSEGMRMESGLIAATKQAKWFERSGMEQ